MKKIVLFCLFLATILVAKTSFASERYQQAFCERWTGEIVKVNPEISYDIYEKAQEALKNPGTPAWTKDSVYYLQWEPIHPFQIITSHVRTGIVFKKDSLSLNKIKQDFPMENQWSILVLFILLAALSQFLFYQKQNIGYLLMTFLLSLPSIFNAIDIGCNMPYFSIAVTSSFFAFAIGAIASENKKILKICFWFFSLLAASEIAFLILGI
jgi:hypothetical protein